MKRALAVTAVGLLLLAAAPAAAESPTDQMRQYTEQVLKILNDATLQEKDSIAALQAAVRKIAIQLFGLAETAREVLGPHWDARTPAEQEEFVRLFGELLEATYIAQMDRQQGLKIRYLGELIEGDRALVGAQVITRRGVEVAVDARLLRREGRWFIYDVSIEGISLLSNYRSQFDRIIRKSSYEELLHRLKAKRDEFLPRRRISGG